MSSMTNEMQLRHLLEPYLESAERPPCPRCTYGAHPMEPRHGDGKVMHPEWLAWFSKHIAWEQGEGDKPEAPTNAPEWIPCPECGGSSATEPKPWANTLRQLLHELRPLHVFRMSSGPDTVVAHDADDAWRVWENHMGELREDYDDCDGWEQQPGDKELTIIDDVHAEERTETSKACAEWAQEGRRHLASTEW
jgi:hypothetical protein